MSMMLSHSIFLTTFLAPKAKGKPARMTLLQGMRGLDQIPCFLLYTRAARVQPPEKTLKSPCFHPTLDVGQTTRLDVGQVQDNQRAWLSTHPQMHFSSVYISASSTANMTRQLFLLPSPITTFVAFCGFWESLSMPHIIFLQHLAL